MHRNRINKKIEGGVDFAGSILRFNGDLVQRDSLKAIIDCKEQAAPSRLGTRHSFQCYADACLLW